MLDISVARYIRCIWNCPSQAGGSHTTCVPCPRESPAPPAGVLQPFQDAIHLWGLHHRLAALGKRHRNWMHHLGHLVCSCNEPLGQDSGEA